MVQEGLGGSRKVQEGLEVWHGLGGSWRIRKSTRGSGSSVSGLKGCSKETGDILFPEVETYHSLQLLLVTA